MQMRSIAKALLMALTTLQGFICLKVIASPFYTNNESLLVYSDRTAVHKKNFLETELVAVRLMDTETLYLSAEAERDNSMSQNQRLLNNSWLASTSRNTYSGTKALRKFLKFNYYSIRDQNRKPGKRAFSVEHDIYTNTLYINSLRNYRLSINENKFSLRYKQRFSFY